MDCWSADLIGPFTKVVDDERIDLSTLHGHSYCLVVVDNHSRYCMVELLHKKSEATDALIKLIRLKHNQLGKKLRQFHCDGGGEFNNKRLGNFLSQEGIKHTCTVAGTSEHNGIVERMNQKLETMARCFITHSNGPVELWGYAIHHSSLLHNHSANKQLQGKTPIQVFEGNNSSALNLESLGVFGCDAYVNISPTNPGKFDPRAAEGIYLGYSPKHNAHRILMLENLEEKIARSVKFNEDSFKHLADNKGRIVRKSELNFSSVSPSEKYYEVSRIVNERKLRGKQQYLVKWKRYETPTWESADKLLQDCPDVVQSYLDERKQTANSLHFALTSILNYRTPNSYSEAMNHPDREKWEEAISQELSAIESNHTWEPVVFPKGRKALSTRFVFKAKHDDQNQIVRWKARLVVRGFLQKFGLDYNETYAPTVHLFSIKYMLAMAAELDLEIMQIDFDTAFLHAPLTEEVYIKPPKGYTLPPGTNALRLRKSLYGLKQAPREWYQALIKALNSLGYHSSPFDDCLLMKIVNGKRMYATVFVDDLLIFMPKDLMDTWEHDKQSLSKLFPIKDIGEVEWILNIRIKRDRKNRTLTLSQENYINMILTDHPPVSERPVKTPYIAEDLTNPIAIENSPRLSPEDHSIYRSIVGQCLYASIISRIDIAHIVALLSRYTHSPTQLHMKAAQRVLQYLFHHRSEEVVLRGNPQRSLNGAANPINLEVWSDSDYAEEKTDRKSLTGWVTTLNSSPVVWKSVKQSTVSLSSTEAELYALGEAVREGIWIRNWLKHYFNISQSVNIKGDNIGSHRSADHPTDRERTKHYDVKVLFVREHIKNGDVKTVKVASVDNIADILTKGAAPTKFLCHKEKLLHSPNG